MEAQDLLTLERVEPLVLSLYQPNTPEVIANTQALLAQIQGLPQAWSLSKELLSRPDEKVQFFGVLTIIVKLNTEGTAISDEEARELLFCLIGWYVDLTSKSGSRLVIRKLVSALSTFFMRYHVIWPRFLDHLGVCLAAGRVCRPEALDPGIGMTSIMEMLGPQQIQALIWVSTHIIEDILRLDPNSVNNASAYKCVLENSDSSMVVMARCFESKGAPVVILEDAIKCLQAWVAFSHKAPSAEYDILGSLKPLVGKVIQFLALDDLFDASVELLTDALSNNLTLFTPKHHLLFETLLKGPWAAEYYRRVAEGDFGFETVQFVQLVLAFADTRMPLLVQTCHSESSEMLSHLCEFLMAQGHPVVDDKIFVPVVEFWSSFAETVPDYLPTEQAEEPPWRTTALTLLLNACSNAWQKIIYPPSNEVAGWDSNDRAGFADSRKDVIDLLQSVYALIGPQLLGTFVETIILSLQALEWLRLEAAVYCLGGLADCCQDDDRCDNYLASVFHSQLFSMLRDPHNTVPTRTQQTCLQLIELYTEYFERNPALLPPALELLFSTLGDKTMAAPASKSILRLCSSCRGHLYPEINAFLAEYGRVIAYQQLDCSTSERTLGALSSVAQAIKDISQRDAKYGRILEFIERELQRCQHLVTVQVRNTSHKIEQACPDWSADEDTGLHGAIKVLRCLVGMGRGVQVPPESTIDLEYDDQGKQPESMLLPEIQKRIVSMIVELQKMFPTSNEVTEQICNVLRTGFSETEPGPFVLPAAEVAQYLTSHSFSTPRVGLFISTACSFISSIRDKNTQPHILSVVLLWVIGLLQQFPTRSNNPRLAMAATPAVDISAEPEIAQNSIELATRILAKEPTIILQTQPANLAEFFFFFTLLALDGSEPLPKAAAAEFWATFVNLRSSEEGFQRTFSDAMAALGPLLCQSLARNIGGNASRSELDKLSEPLKKLFNRHPKAKQWLEAGLNDPSFPSTKVSQSEKAVFVKKVASLRGARGTNQVVRDFWLAARGSNFSYAA